MTEITPAACYVCLDELDESNKPTVRNCSCRGDAAGFAHLSCIIKYAEGKSTEALNSSAENKFTEPWIICPNCHQFYCGKLALDLANAFVEFVEREYPAGCNWQYLEAYSNKLRRYTTRNETNIGATETKHVMEKCLSIIVQLMSSEHNIRANWAREVMGTANVYSACAYYYLNQCDESGENAKKTIEYLEKSRDAFGAIGDDAGVTCMESKIDQYKRMFSGYLTADLSEFKTPEQKLQLERKVYETSIKSDGEAMAVTMGLNYATALKDAYHGIAAIRQMNRIISISKQYHGPDHIDTKKLESFLEEYSTYFVIIELYGCSVQYQALRYEREKCVVQGPVREPRLYHQERISIVEADRISSHCKRETPIRTPI
jgi:hypothetical protein